MVIDQANAVWRRQISTAATAAANRSNEINAKAVLDISNSAYNDLWQHYADLIEFSIDAAESELDRNADMAIAELTADTRKVVAAEQASSAGGAAIGGLSGLDYRQMSDEKVFEIWQNYQRSFAGGLIGTLGSAAITKGWFSDWSDIRLKTNIEKIGSLNSVIDLYSWEWNEVAYELGASDHPTVGVLAQELIEYRPDLVHMGDDGYFRVNYGGLFLGDSR